MVATLWCHGNVCSTVVVAGASPIDNGSRFLSITWNKIGHQAQQVDAHSDDRGMSVMNEMTLQSDCWD